MSTVGKYLLDQLYNLGLRHIFGIPGDYILKFNKEIELHQGITFIGTTRENTAGYMADAYARVNGLGAASITYGVGINIVNATAQAFVESVPIVIISGAAGLNEFKKCHELHHLINSTISEFQDLSQFEIFKNITIAQASINDIEIAAYEIDRVLNACIENKKPVYIELPRNIIDSKISINKKFISNKSNDINSNIVKESIELLQKSKHPVIWIGHEIDRHNLAEDILTFSRNNNIPIISTLLGKTTIDENDPHYMGIYKGELSLPHIKDFVDKSDCILSLGAILSDMDTGIFTDKKDYPFRIFVNKSTCIIGNQIYSDFLFQDYIRAIKDIKLDISFNNSFIPANCKNTITYKARNTKITSESLFLLIEKNIQDKNIIVTDIGDCLFGCADFILNKGCFVACTYFATLGFGVPAAIATQLACPNQRVIGIVGDGAFQMTCTEIATAIRYNINPIIIVLNNHGYGTERPLIEGNYNDVHDWNYIALCDLFRGGIGIEVKTEEEFERSFLRALNDKENLYLIEIELDKMDFSPGLKKFLNLAQTITRS